jgi:hypothetical protein
MFPVSPIWFLWKEEHTHAQNLVVGQARDDLYKKNDRSRLYNFRSLFYRILMAALL